MPRGELYSIVQAIERTCPHQPLQVTSDSEVNVKLSQRGPNATADAANYDLRCRLWAAQRARLAPFVLKWSKGHATKQHLIDGKVTYEDLVGNYGADAMAGVAAEKCPVSMNDSTKVLWARALVMKIQKERWRCCSARARGRPQPSQLHCPSSRRWRPQRWEAPTSCRG